MRQAIPGGTVHKSVPSDLALELKRRAAAMKTWQDITPLARNEWICLVTSAKQPETRVRRIKRTYDQLSHGQRRPCCWLGCTHRPDKPLSPSQKYVIAKKSVTNS